MTEFDLAGFFMFYLLFFYFNIRRLLVNEKQLALCESVNWEIIVNHIDSTLGSRFVPSNSHLCVRNKLHRFSLSKVNFPFFSNVLCIDWFKLYFKPLIVFHATPRVQIHSIYLKHTHVHHSCDCVKH